MIVTFQKYLLLGLSLWASFGISTLSAAVVLAHYSGGGDPTSFVQPGLLSWQADNSNSRVISTSATVNGRVVRKMTDPGLDRGTVFNSLYYSVRPSTAQISSLVSNGWDLTMSMKIPGLLEVPGGAWNRDGNTSLGFYYVDPLLPGNRTSFLITAGRDAAGNTLIFLTGGERTLTLTPEFHEYTMSYRNGLLTLYVDGVAQLTTSGTTAANASTINLLYWGDNSNAEFGPAYGQRIAYYESITFTQVPEPTYATLLFLGGVGWVLRRTRRASTERVHLS